MIDSLLTVKVEGNSYFYSFYLCCMNITLSCHPDDHREEGSDSINVDVLRSFTSLCFVQDDKEEKLKS